MQGAQDEKRGLLERLKSKRDHKDGGDSKPVVMTSALSVPTKLIKKKHPRKLPASFSKGLSDAQLPLLRYNGRIIYCYHRDECNLVCDNLMTSHLNVMGFDMEWRVSFRKGGGAKKTALIQLCASQDTCYLFQISRMSGFPIALKYLLEEEKILLTGVGIKSDIAKLSRDYQVNSKGLVDLAVLANETLNSNEKWSLNGLVMNLFKKQLNKDPRIRCGNWEALPLSYNQKRYAAIDAYAGLILYKKLQSIRSNLDQLNVKESDVKTIPE